MGIELPGSTPIIPASTWDSDASITEIGAVLTWIDSSFNPDMMPPIQPATEPDQPIHITRAMIDEVLRLHGLDRI